MSTIPCAPPAIEGRIHISGARRTFPSAAAAFPKHCDYACALQGFLPAPWYRRVYPPCWLLTGAALVVALLSLSPTA